MPDGMGSQRFRAAIVGCGRVARRHVARMLQDPRVVITVLCDPDRANAERLAREFGPPVAHRDQ